MALPHSNEPLTNLSVRKSNDFVTARFSSSLLENQLLAIGLTRIENTMAGDSDLPLIARLYPGELKRLISDPAHIYRDLKVVSKRLVGHNFFIEDGKGNFRAHAIITDAIYEDGIFTIKFNDSLKQYIFNLEAVGNFTSYELSMMTDFTRSSSFRIYEVLKKELYKIKKNDYESCIYAQYNLSEFRFIIGLANSDNPVVKNTLSRASIIDWDDIFEKLDKKDKKYEEWRDFQRRILKPAQEELKQKSDIRFEYEGIRDGRKIKHILFKIYRNIPENPERIDERKRFMDEKAKEYRQYELPMDLHESFYDKYVGHNELSKDDIDLLLKKAEYSEEKVEKAIMAADSQPEIENYMGWIIRCIERDNYETKGVVYGNSESYKELKGLRNKVEKDKVSIAKTVWDRYKQKDDFDDFFYETFDVMTIEQIELAYDEEKLCQMYADWHKSKH